MATTKKKSPTKDEKMVNRTVREDFRKKYYAVKNEKVDLLCDIIDAKNEIERLKREVAILDASYNFSDRERRQNYIDSKKSMAAVKYLAESLREAANAILELNG